MRCVLITPLGMPVEPDVNRILPSVSGPTRANAASTASVGRTSVTVKVEVFAERFLSQGEYIKVTEATLTYVAIDENGRPRAIEKD